MIHSRTLLVLDSTFEALGLLLRASLKPLFILGELAKKRKERQKTHPTETPSSLPSILARYPGVPLGKDAEPIGSVSSPHEPTPLPATRLTPPTIQSAAGPVSIPLPHPAPSRAWEGFTGRRGGTMDADGVLVAHHGGTRAASLCSSVVMAALSMPSPLPWQLGGA